MTSFPEPSKPPQSGLTVRNLHTNCQVSVAKTPIASGEKALAHVKITMLVQHGATHTHDKAIARGATSSADRFRDYRR